MPLLSALVAVDVYVRVLATLSDQIGGVERSRLAHTQASVGHHEQQGEVTSTSCGIGVDGRQQSAPPTGWGKPQSAERSH